MPVGFFPCCTTDAHFRTKRRCRTLVLYQRVVSFEPPSTPDSLSVQSDSYVSTLLLHTNTRAAYIVRSSVTSLRHTAVIQRQLLSSWMWRRVFTGNWGELRRKVVLRHLWIEDSFTLKMEAACSSEMLLNVYQTTRSCIFIFSAAITLNFKFLIVPTRTSLQWHECIKNIVIRSF
jgi:hypothetical protein